MLEFSKPIIWIIALTCAMGRKSPVSEAQGRSSLCQGGAASQKGTHSQILLSSLAQWSATEQVNDIRFSPDGRLLAASSGFHTGTQDLDSRGSVQLWQTDNKRLLSQFKPSSPQGYELNYDLRDLVFAKNDLLMVSDRASAGVFLWNFKKGLSVTRFSSPGGLSTGAFALSPDGKVGAVGSLWGENGSTRLVRLWNFQTGKALRSLEGINNFVRSLTFSPDGRELACSTTRLELPHGHIGGHIEGETGIFDTLNGQMRLKLPGAAGKLLYSPRGELLLCATGAGIQVWSSKTGQLKATLLRNTQRREINSIVDIAFAPGSSIIAAASEDGTVAFWDLNTQRLLNTFADSQHRICAIGFSKHNSYFATGNKDKTVKLWRVELKVSPQP